MKGIIYVSIDNWKNGNAEIAANLTVNKEDIKKAVKNAGYTIDVEQEIIAEDVASTERFDFDLIIIGGGSAAFAAALRASELGKKTLMINDGLPIGGTCVNVGCIPSKTLIRTAEALHHHRYTPFESISQGEAFAHTNGSVFDFSQAIQQKRALVEEMR
ncbi:MAG: FAD-dependent oxidoreductase, partial [Calditrichae bacterium]|nr:FAD-dependent oxidoreductase [Calditrichia bacterium]